MVSLRTSLHRKPVTFPTSTFLRVCISLMMIALTTVFIADWRKGGKATALVQSSTVEMTSIEFRGGKAAIVS